MLKVTAAKVINTLQITLFKLHHKEKAGLRTFAKLLGYGKESSIISGILISLKLFLLKH